MLIAIATLDRNSVERWKSGRCIIISWRSTEINCGETDHHGLLGMMYMITRIFKLLDQRKRDTLTLVTFVELFTIVGVHQFTLLEAIGSRLWRNWPSPAPLVFNHMHPQVAWSRRDTLAQVSFLCSSSLLDWRPTRSSTVTTLTAILCSTCLPLKCDHGWLQLPLFSNVTI